LRQQPLERVEAEIARVKSEGAPFSLLALDLDHFENGNDSYGHQMGDNVRLRETRVFVICRGSSSICVAAITQKLG
jgi:diguanylate cyclase (GGDEF)-like protein